MNLFKWKENDNFYKSFKTKEAFEGNILNMKVKVMVTNKDRCHLKIFLKNLNLIFTTLLTILSQNQTKQSHS